MRYLIPIMTFIFLGNAGKSQSLFQGEYRMDNIVDDSLLSTVILKLNCNGTYIRNISDSSQIAYGKWKMKSGNLVLSGDSVFVNNKIEIVKYKLVYENIENKFHIKSVPKKEYLEMLSEVRKFVPNVKQTREGYKEYEKQMKAGYYEKVIEYNCK